MDPLQHLNALMYAAEEGQSKLPHVKITLCPSCHGLQFDSDYDIYHVRHVVTWESFLATRYPARMLCTVIEKMRHQLSDTVATQARA